MFEEVIKQLSREDTDTRNVYLHLEESNIEYMKKRLLSMDQLSDEEAYHVISVTYKHILDEIFISNNGKLINFLYTNTRFIMIFTNVLSNPKTVLTEDQKIYCNRLAYDYFTARCEKDDYTRSLLLNMSKTVNRTIIPSLVGLGLNEELAAYLVNARYSSKKEDIQVKRLNLVIMQQPVNVMTVQMIVDIYGKLFKRITPLFSGIMYDIYHEFINKDMEEIYATINVAILEIVNNLPDNIMYNLLRNFSVSHSLIHLDERIRFNIYSICKDDYPRLYNMLEMLSADQINIPF